MTLKEHIHKLVDELPEGSPDETLEAMQYRLYVLRKVQRGLQSIDEGRGITHEQVVERMKKCQQE